VDDRGAIRYTGEGLQGRVGRGMVQVRFARVLMAACAVGALAVAAAAAQTDNPDQVYLEARELIENRQRGVYIARGSVRLVAGERVLYADELTYDPALGRVAARGSVRLFEGLQPAQFADEIILDDDMVEGVAYGFAALLENNGRAAAAAALRRPDGSVELQDAYYTACELCEDGGAPTWRLRADEVIRDLDDEVIRYRDMSLELRGVPILYTPYFAHADPAAKRRSGFLLPSVDISNRLGFSYQQPYYWAISPYQDLVIAPRVMSEANPLIELEYRRRFYSGEVKVELSFTNEQEYVDGPDPDSEGEWSGDYEFRGHVFAEGRFDISPEWRWGFGLQAVDDALYLRRYDYSEQPEETSALFQFDQRTLISQLYVAGRGERYYTDASTIRFQLLNQNFDNDRLPGVAPLVRFSGEAPLPDGFGDLDINASAVNLRRELGEDHMRASVGFEWTAPLILPGGVRTEAFALGRVDGYSFNTVDRNGAEIDSTDFTRTLGAAGVDVSWPFLRPGERFNTILAPRAFLVAASGLDDDEIPRAAETDTLDLDRTNLFSANRVGGNDVWEDGARVDLGASGVFDAVGRNPLRVEAFVGRSYRLDGEPRLSEASGVFEDESDWVAELSAEAGLGRIAARTRIDTETGDVNRLDVDASVRFWRLDAGATYTDIADPAAPRELRELKANAQFDVTERWSLTWNVVRDLDDSITRRTQAGLRYRDECTDFRIFWQREDLQIGDLGPSESIKFEIVLFTLGGIGED
jgi:LPS-assembly protein